MFAIKCLVAFFSVFILLFFILLSTPVNLVQPPFKPKKRDNVGYFLHITDIHLDDNYTVGGSIGSACHDTDAETSKIAGPFGETDCDTPVALAKMTLDWVNRTWADHLDFVVWTGDNARHDWDKQVKRDRGSVYRSNQLVASMMRETFRGVPVVPCLGNNDVIPHNKISDPASSGKTRRLLQFYLDLWQPWIPNSQIQPFAQHGGLVVHVAPQLRVLSLNTMYFIKKNKKVRGCHRKGEPAEQHLAWFEAQLELARQEDAKVLVIGHVPPTSDYRYSCLDGYTRTAANYADVLVGHLFGHLNKDHFLLYDTSRTHVRAHGDNDDDNDDNDDDMDEHGAFWRGAPENQNKQRAFQNRDGAVGMARKKNIKIPRFARELRDMYSSLNPRHLDRLTHKNDDDDDDNVPKSPVVAFQVSPSVLPKFHPTVRVYSYNKTDGTLLGYHQFFADIKEWERKGSPHDFKLEYATSTDYAMPDLSAESFYELAKRMVNPDDKKGDKLWKAYVENIFVQTRDIYA
ncbi:Metallo-dependent phosphatase-like protein [Gongronella butleri]|nr:Metallo-dependent phosphatase-like protein [Gongronella butleri]